MMDPAVKESFWSMEPFETGDLLEFIPDLFWEGEW